MMTQPGSAPGRPVRREGGFTHRARTKLPCVPSSPSRTRRRPRRNEGQRRQSRGSIAFYDADDADRPFTTKLGMNGERDSDTFPAYRGRQPTVRGATPSKLDVASPES